MSRRLGPVVVFAAITGALTYLFSGAWAAALTWLGDRQSFDYHKAIFLQYWTDPAWVIAACLVACTVLVTALPDSRSVVAAWRRWPLWGLLPAGTYVLTLAVLVPILRAGELSDGIYVAAWTAIDGSLWMTLLSPLLARVIVSNVRPWMVHFAFHNETTRYRRRGLTGG